MNACPVIASHYTTVEFCYLGSFTQMDNLLSAVLRFQRVIISHTSSLQFSDPVSWDLQSIGGSASVTRAFKLLRRPAIG